MKKSLLALVMVAAFSTQASAGTVTADHYTITYDDSFWGIATGTAAVLNDKTDTLTFSSLGLSAAVTAGRFGERSESANWYSGSEKASSLLTITANSGYKIASITTGATGALRASGADSSDAYAYAESYIQGYWDTGSGYNSQMFDPWTSVDASSSNQGQYRISSTTDFSANSNGESPAARSFSDASGSPADAYTQSATLSYFYANLYATAFGQGSKSSASLGKLAFTVDVVQLVPEPESYAMFLAGLGIIGAVARRRSKKA